MQRVWWKEYGEGQRQRGYNIKTQSVMPVLTADLLETSPLTPFPFGLTNSNHPLKLHNKGRGGQNKPKSEGKKFPQFNFRLQITQHAPESVFIGTVFMRLNSIGLSVCSKRNYICYKIFVYYGTETKSLRFISAIDIFQ